MRSGWLMAVVLAVSVCGEAEDMPTLNWMEREKAVRADKNVVLKILREDKSLSYSVPAALTQGTQSPQSDAKGDVSAGRAVAPRPPSPATDNLLVHGDNLEALKALLPFYAGRVKCIYIDPPYNTGSAFEHYDDNLEHSQWLCLMYPRLKLLREFLSEEGSIWISIDDDEVHYLKVICDEIFGRKNFVIQVTIKRGAATGHKAINPTPVQVSDYMIVYAKNKRNWSYQPVYAKREFDKAYAKYILNFDAPYQEWKFGSLKDLLKEKNCTIDKLLKTDAYRIVRTAQPAYDAVGEETRKLIDESRSNPEVVFLQERKERPNIYLKNGERILFYKDKMRMIDGELVTAELVTSMWADMNYQGIAKEGGVKFLKSKKPEAQIARVLEMATNPGDLVLDSFLGSGTTCAVAQKMGRRWIGIEMGEHAKTHCAVRLKKVIDGEQGGISKAVGWKGGGAFRFYELGEPIFDKNGSITDTIPYETLAAHVWFMETGCGWTRDDGGKSTVLGVHDGVAYALLYNGILHDRRVTGGNVLTPKTLKVILGDLGEVAYERIVIYGECTKIGAAKLKELRIEFRQTPYDIMMGR